MRTKERGNGKGSVFCVPGRRSPWVANVTVGWTEDGLICRATRFLPTEEEAWATLAEMQDKIAAGIHPNEGLERPEIRGYLPARKLARTRRVTAQARFLILQRDGFACRYCGRRPPEVILHVDHVQPWSKGGPDDPSNLVTACRDCNLGKQDLTLAQPMVG